MIQETAELGTKAGALVSSTGLGKTSFELQLVSPSTCLEQSSHSRYIGLGGFSLYAEGWFTPMPHIL